MGDHLRGYWLTSDPTGQVRHGPQPYEAIVSEILETFPGTLPRAGGVEDQDWQLIRAIMEYRSIKAGLELFRRGKAGMEALAKQPGICNLLLEMDRAQDGEWQGMDGMMREMEALQLESGADEDAE